MSSCGEVRAVVIIPLAFVHVMTFTNRTRVSAHSLVDHETNSDS
jgi:hypothetical protein